MGLFDEEGAEAIEEAGLDPDDFRDLEKTFEEYKSENRLKDKIVTKYEKIIEEYRKHLKGYTHKDQKPF